MPSNSGLRNGQVQQTGGSMPKNSHLPSRTGKVTVKNSSVNRGGKSKVMNATNKRTG